MINMANEANKQAARKLTQESARDYLKLNITLPLGNPALKKVHTNQFLFMDLPSMFGLKNWESIAQVLQSVSTRFQGYILGRWYIETSTIDVDVKSRKGTMSLNLNAFPSPTDTFSSDFRKFQDAYNNAVKNANTSNSNSSSSSSGGSKTKSTNYFSSKAGKNVSSDLATAAKQITEVCSTEEQRAYCIYDWVDRYVVYSKYWSYKYSSSQVLTGHKANCYDTAFLIYNLCTKCKPKVRCEIYNGTYHFLDETIDHLWNKLPYRGKMTFADTGRLNRNPIGNHGSGRYIVSGGSTPYRKNY